MEECRSAELPPKLAVLDQMGELARDELVKPAAGIPELDGIRDGEGEHVCIDLLRGCIDGLDLHLGDGGCYPNAVLRCPRMRDTPVALEADERGAQ